MAKSSEKKQFRFHEEKTTAEAFQADRNADALEFIAHYLDRIEGHLERIADSLEQNAGATGRVAEGIHALRK
jgi:hypothetical protein